MNFYSNNQQSTFINVYTIYYIFDLRIGKEKKLRQKEKKKYFY
jgi:hypothetical protein